MVKLSKEDVEHITRLANLTLSPQELEKYQKQLSEVVGYVGELSEVDTGKIEPTSQTTGLENVFRQDLTQPQNSLSQEEATAQSENIHKGYFKVSAILQERSDK